MLGQGIAEYDEDGINCAVTIEPTDSADSMVVSGRTHTGPKPCGKKGYAGRPLENAQPKQSEGYNDHA